MTVVDPLDGGVCIGLQHIQCYEGRCTGVLGEGLFVKSEVTHGITDPTQKQTDQQQVLDDGADAV